MAVDYCDLAEAGAADRGGHGGVAEDGDDGDGGAGYKRGLCLRYKHLADYLKVARTH